MCSEMRCSYITQVHFTESLGESISKTSADLFQNVPFVVVAQSASDFVVRHLWPVAMFTP